MRRGDGGWYGIWTGPDSFNGPDNPRPGEADAHLATALTDSPALNAHMHTGPLRALMDIVGVEGTARGLRITPRVPSETLPWNGRACSCAAPRSRLAGRSSPAPTARWNWRWRCRAACAAQNCV